MTSLTHLNALTRDEFMRAVGSVFEHSPWIAEAAWAKRPFDSVEKLHDALCETVHVSGEEKQLALVRAHPDLVGRLALAGQLTKESTGEQASAGLSQLPGQSEPSHEIGMSEDERELFFFASGADDFAKRIM